MRRIVILLALAASPALAATVDPATLPAAGPAVTCVDDTGLQYVVTESHDWLVLRRGRSAWRAALVDGCPGLSRFRIIVRRNTQGRLCRNELVDVVDPVGPMSYGLCRIGAIEAVTIPRGTRF